HAAPTIQLALDVHDEGDDEIDRSVDLTMHPLEGFAALRGLELEVETRWRAGRVQVQDRKADRGGIERRVVDALQVPLVATGRARAVDRSGCGALPAEMNVGPVVAREG